MKRLLAIFLFLCISAPFWLNYSIYYVNRMMVRSEVLQKIRAGIKDSEKVTIKLSRAEADREITWKEHTEFRYRGQFYDVIESEQLPDSVVFVCYWDKEETFIAEIFETILFEEFAGDFESDGSSDHFVDFIKIPYKVNSFRWAALSHAGKEKSLSISIDFYKSLRLTPPSPPPRAV